ncbi:alpha/beta fold hydrolase [Caenimonas sedimenti]|uniref:Alpha/beta fold hydrolase n=1 Tax=Caenimonas sedimenti TaxID=2596921 RepID=A0A562ZTU3_9BURK|nr:alpha/beta fold hydrolase [Caenimonas sedimenti]
MVWHAWGDGEPLVLLHGGSGSWTHWLRNVEALAAAGRRVLAPDLPGSGESALPAGAADADDLVDPLAASLREVAGDGPHDIVGFSFGGLTAGLLAQRYHGLVRKLVLVGVPGLGVRGERLKLRTWRDEADAAAREAVHRHNLGVLMLHRPESIDALALALHAANLSRDRMRSRRLALTDILARALPTLACERHAIFGAQDALYADFWPGIQRLFAADPGFGELVFIPGAGHWVQFEEAAAFNTELLRLLKKR